MRGEVLARPLPLLDMSDGDAEQHLVKDIARGPAESWRWTQQRPTIKMKIAGATGWKYRVDFTIAGSTFKETGPVTLSFFVNDHEIGKVRYDQPGTKVFEAPVPPSWLNPAAENTFAAEIDKVWVAPDDGARLGFILSRMGLTN